jgi:hypothetical protein
MNPYVTFLLSLSQAFQALASSISEEERHTGTESPVPPAPVAPAPPPPPAPVEDEDYTSYHNRSGVTIVGPGGEIGGAFIFSGGVWTPPV